MNFASELTDKKQISVYSQPYESYDHMLRYRRKQLSWKYNFNSITSASGTGYYQLQDGGSPQAIVYRASSGPWAIVNSPVYICAPPSSVTGTPLAGGSAVTFTLSGYKCT